MSLHVGRPGTCRDRALVLAIVLTVSACGPAAAPPASVAPSDEWREFEGSWNATGTRRTIAAGADHRASIVDLSGTMLLAGSQRPGVGFRAEGIALVDSSTGLVGRALWTDENGDQVWSDLTGQGTAAGNRIEGKIRGGTGRYVGVEGAYEFSWQYVLEAGDGTVQGRAIGLKGRVRTSSTTKNESQR